MTSTYLSCRCTERVQPHIASVHSKLIPKGQINAWLCTVWPCPMWLTVPPVLNANVPDTSDQLLRSVSIQGTSVGTARVQGSLCCESSGSWKGLRGPSHHSNWQYSAGKGKEGGTALQDSSGAQEGLTASAIGSTWLAKARMLQRRALAATSSTLSFKFGPIWPSASSSIAIARNALSSAPRWVRWHSVSSYFALLASPGLHGQE